MLTTFCETLLLSNNIVELSISVSGFTPARVIALTEVFRSIHSFRKINLRSNSSNSRSYIREEQSLLLFTALMNNTTLKSLDLSGLILTYSRVLVRLLNTFNLSNLVFPRSFRTLSFEDFFTLLNIICIKKMVIALYKSTDRVDIENGVFCISPEPRGSLTAKEVSILSLFLKCFIIKSLTFKNCDFSGTTITDLCHSVKMNRLLIAVDFSRIRLTDNDFCNLIEALSSSSSIRSINLNGSDLHLYQLSSNSFTLTVHLQLYERTLILLILIMLLLFMIVELTTSI
ncbi:hypothetical protein GEMRC1_000216 [Eukaryota sp. GEM-RC1]